MLKKVEIENEIPQCRPTPLSPPTEGNVRIVSKVSPHPLPLPRRGMQG
ncbi:MAG: hypothetical protein LBP62_02475 [Clostridiales bacterium]|nr:hypothetical protein [Clostridiales bacterium]